MIMLSDTRADNAAAVPVYEPHALYLVPIEMVREDPNQPRKSFDIVSAQIRNITNINS